MQLKDRYEEKGYCGVAQAAGPGIAGTRKQEGKKTSGLTMLHFHGYVKVSSAKLTQI